MRTAISNTGLALIACGALSLAASPALPCTSDFPSSMARALDGGAQPVFKTEAPPGALWWLDASLRLGAGDTVALEGSDGATATTEVLWAGPASLALRVPAQLAPGSTWRMEGSELLLTVTGEVLPDDLAPSVLSEPSAVPGFDSYAACPSSVLPITTARNELRFAQLLVPIELSPGTTLDDVVVDAWVLPPGMPLPDEAAPRSVDAAVASAFADPATPGLLSPTVMESGEWDVHLRLRDVRTGEASALRTVRASAPADSFRRVGCAAAPDGTLVGLALLVGLLLRRRRSGRR